MDIQKVLRQNVSFTQSAEIREFCKPLFAYGITTFAHIHVDRHNVASFLCSDPHYLASFLQRPDLFQHSLLQQKPSLKEHYILSDFLMRKGKTLEIYNFMHQYGMGHLFTIVHNNLDASRDYYYFASALDNYDINSKYLWYLYDLNKFISEYKDKVKYHRLLECHDDLKAYMNPPQSDFIQGGFAKFDIANVMKMVSRKPILYKGNNITKREFECLYWMSQSKNYAEIADILHIVPRTVKAHVDRVRHKTGIKTLFQLGMLFNELRAESLDFSHLIEST